MPDWRDDGLRGQDNSPLSITLDRYGHRFPSVGREAAEKLDDLLGDEGAAGE